MVARRRSAPGQPRAEAGGAGSDGGRRRSAAAGASAVAGASEEAEQEQDDGRPPLLTAATAPTQAATSTQATSTQASTEGGGGSKRARRESSEPVRKSGRGQRMRKSDAYLQLEAMKFPEPLIAAALRACPDNLEGAIEFIFRAQQQPPQPPQATQATQPPSQATQREGEEGEGDQKPAAAGSSSSSSASKKKRAAKRKAPASAAAASEEEGPAAIASDTGGKGEPSADLFDDLGPAAVVGPGGAQLPSPSPAPAPATAGATQVDTSQQSQSQQPPQQQQRRKGRKRQRGAAAAAAAAADATQTQEEQGAEEGKGQGKGQGQTDAEAMPPPPPSQRSSSARKRRQRGQPEQEASASQQQPPPPPLPPAPVAQEEATAAMATEEAAAREHEAAPPSLPPALPQKEEQEGKGAGDGQPEKPSEEGEAGETRAPPAASPPPPPAPESEMEEGKPTEAPTAVVAAAAAEEKPAPARVDAVSEAGGGQEQEPEATPAPPSPPLVVEAAAAPEAPTEGPRRQEEAEPPQPPQPPPAAAAMAPPDPVVAPAASLSQDEDFDYLLSQSAAGASGSGGPGPAALAALAARRDQPLHHHRQPPPPPPPPLAPRAAPSAPTNGRDKEIMAAAAAAAAVPYNGPAAGGAQMRKTPPPPPPPMRVMGPPAQQLQQRQPQPQPQQARVAGPPPSAPTPAPLGGFAGFQTGRGKRVEVSEEALAKADRFFDGGQEEQQQQQAPAPPAASAAPAAAASSAAGGGFGGFQTGRGKRVEVSEEALVKAERLFERGQQQEAQVLPLIPAAPSVSAAAVASSSGFGGFQTGRGKRVEVSEEALAKADRFFEGGQQEQQHEAQAPPVASAPPAATASSSAGGGFGGFQTGRGKRVEVSEEALAKADRFFEGGQQHEANAPTSPPPQLPSAVPSPLPPVAAPAAENEEQGREQEQEQEEEQQPLVDAGITTVAMEVEEAAPATAAAAAGPPPEAAAPKPEEKPIAPPPALPPPAQCQDRALTDLRALARDRGVERLRLRDLGLCPGALPPHLLPSYGLRPATLAVTAADAHRLRFDADELPAKVLPAPEASEEPEPPPPHPTQQTQEAAAALIARRAAALGRTLEVSLPPEEAASWAEAVVAGLQQQAAAPTDEGAAAAAAAVAAVKPPSAAWLAHHYRLVVWKLACTERGFPEVVGGRYLTKERVLRQLQYRYAREVLRGKRPALRVVLNGDAPAARPMVLCVSRVFPCLTAAPLLPTAEAAAAAAGAAAAATGEEAAGGPSAAAAPPVRVELTDGWYCVDGLLDAGLSALVYRGRVRVGSKLAIAGASLQLPGASDGVEPLEVKATDLEARPALRLALNSTRPARWDAALGFLRPGRALSVPVSGLAPGGGAASALEVVVVRRYQTLYLERRRDPVTGAQTTTRVLTEAEEEDAQRAHEAELQARMERLLDEEDREREREWHRAAAGAGLATQGEVSDAMRAERQATLEEVRRRVLDDPDLQRDARPFFRAKVCSVKTAALPLVSGGGNAEEKGGRRRRVLLPEWRGHSVEEVKANTGVLTVWEPSPALDEGLREGAHVALHGVTAPPLRGKGPAPSLIRLTASGNNVSLRPLAPRGAGAAAADGADPELLAYARYEPRCVLPSVRAAKARFGADRGPFVARDFDAVGVHLASIVWELPSTGHGGQHRRQAADGDAEEGGDRDRDRKPTVTRLFFTDASGCILCVEKRDYDQQPPAAPSAGGQPQDGEEVWALTDLGFQSYDAKTDTVLASLSAWSGTRRGVSPRALSRKKDAYVHEAMQALAAWAKTPDGRAVLQAERARLLALLGGLAPASGPLAATGAARSATLPRERLRGSLLRVSSEEGPAADGSDGGADDAVAVGGSLRLEVDLEGRECVLVRCQRQYALRRLAQALYHDNNGGESGEEAPLPASLRAPPSGGSAKRVGGHGRSAGAWLRAADVAEAAEAQGAEHGAPSWGALTLDMLVQRTDAEGGDSGDASMGMGVELELLDVRVIPAAKQALHTLNHLLRADASFALLAAAAGGGGGGGGSGGGIM